jgi:hypothetical protein
MGQKWADGTRQALTQPEKIKTWRSWNDRNQMLFWKNPLQSLPIRVYFSFQQDSLKASWTYGEG